MFEDRKILLVGDTILDVYTYCDIIGQALYAAIPEVEERRSAVLFGGNSLIASNILELGGKVSFISILGADADAKQYSYLKHPNLKKFFLVDKTRKTTVKRRWFVGNKALFQANQVDNHNVSFAIEKKIIQLFKKNIHKTDVVVVMDPQHGMMTKNLIHMIVQLSKKYNKPLYVDTQISHRSSNSHLYRGADTMLLNQKEITAIYPKFTIRESEKALRSIKKKFDLKNLIVKLGEHGSVAIWGETFIKNSGYKVKALDVCGAGDAFLSALCLSDRNKPEESLKISNIWGALSTTVHGTVPPKKKDLIRILKQNKR